MNSNSNNKNDQDVDAIPLNNADSFFDCKIMHGHFSPFEIIKKVASFSWYELCFET